MVFRRYSDIESFKTDVLDILLEDEVRNNLPVSIVQNSSKFYNENWLLATVADEQGVIVLIAICTLPYNILLYKPVKTEDADGQLMHFLASQLKQINFKPPGVLAESDLARCFANAYCGHDKYDLKMTMMLMQLDKLTDYKTAPGFSRVLNEDDLSYTPSWEHAFSVDCTQPLHAHAKIYEQIKSRLGKNIHFIWEDGKPVAQAVQGRVTPNGAAITYVYTPPEFRGNGYATSVVAEVSKSALDQGKRFCYLFADVANPVSCAVYHKLGYYDVCLFDEIKFDTLS